MGAAYQFKDHPSGCRADESEVGWQQRASSHAAPPVAAYVREGTHRSIPEPSAIVPPWNNSSPAGFVAQIATDGISLKWASYVMSSDLRSPGGPNFDAGVSAMAVNPAGDIYLGGLTGPGFPVTASAPEICFQGFATSANGFLAHLNAIGALLDATYLGNNGGDINFVGGLMPLPGSAVLVASRDSGKWHRLQPPVRRRRLDGAGLPFHRITQQRDAGRQRRCRARRSGDAHRFWNRA